MSDRCHNCGNVPNPDGSCACKQIHVEMKDGAVARVQPEAMNDPAFVDAMNKLIEAARASLGGGGGLGTERLQRSAAGSGVSSLELEARRNSVINELEPE